METPYMFSNELDIEFAIRMSEFEHITKRNILDWLFVDGNFYYMDKDDIALFNYETPFLYTGHYFFTSKGKDARNKGKAILEQFFDLFDKPVVLRGLTPTNNRAAKWMNRQLGFKSFGEIQTAPNELCELFILKKEELKHG